MRKALLFIASVLLAATASAQIGSPGLTNPVNTSSFLLKNTLNTVTGSTGFTYTSGNNTGSLSVGSTTSTMKVRYNPDGSYNQFYTGLGYAQIQALKYYDPTFNKNTVLTIAPTAVTMVQNDYAGVTYGNVLQTLKSDSDTSPGTMNPRWGFLACDDTGTVSNWDPEWGNSKNSSFDSCTDGSAAATGYVGSGNSIINIAAGDATDTFFSSLGISAQATTGAAGLLLTNGGTGETSEIALQPQGAKIYNPFFKHQATENAVQVDSATAAPVIAMEANASAFILGGEFQFTAVQQAANKSVVSASYPIICFEGVCTLGAAMRNQLYETNAGSADLVCTPTAATVGSDIEFRVNCNNVHSAQTLIFPQIVGQMYNNGFVHTGAATP